MFSYVYGLIHQSVVTFCLVFFRKSAAQFFIVFMVVLYFVVEVLFSFSVMFMSVLCFVMFSFLYLVMFMCLVLCHRIAVQFFWYLPILVMLSLFCVPSCLFICIQQCSCVRCSVIKFLFRFFVFINFSNVHVWLVLCHVQFLVFANFINLHICFVFRHVYFLFICQFYYYFMFKFLYLPILLMLLECTLMHKCTCLFLSLWVVYLFFDTLYFRVFLYFFNFSNVNVNKVHLNMRLYLFVLVFVVEVVFILFLDLLGRKEFLFIGSLRRESLSR